MKNINNQQLLQLHNEYQIHFKEEQAKQPVANPLCLDTLVERMILKERDNPLPVRAS